MGYMDNNGAGRRRRVKYIRVPLEIWMDDTMTEKEKRLLMKIDSCTEKGRDCHLSNHDIGKFLGVKERRTIYMLNSLCEKGWVTKMKTPEGLRALRSNLRNKLKTK